MRTQSEPPGHSINGEEQQSVPSSPTSSAVTAVSGRSSLGIGLQYRGAWCTPPRIFMDHQVALPQLMFLLIAECFPPNDLAHLASLGVYLDFKKGKYTPIEGLRSLSDWFKDAAGIRTFFTQLLVVLIAISGFLEQDEIIPHLEPGRPPSTVDPDSAQQMEKGKKLPQRPVRISAWKLAKLDTDEAVKAGAKARASSSVLRPVGTKQNPQSDQVSSSNVSGRSSPMSVDQGFNHKTVRKGALSLSPSKGTCPQSHVSMEDSESCSHSVSNYGSPQISNIAAYSTMRQSSSREHINPIYQTSGDESPWSKRSEGNQSNLHEHGATNPPRRNLGASESSRNSVFWDPEASRFVSSASRSVGSSEVPPAELSYTGQSIFYGGPLVNEQDSRGVRTASSTPSAMERGGNLSLYQQGRSHRGGQLPVFVPSDYQENQFPHRFT